MNSEQIIFLKTMSEFLYDKSSTVPETLNFQLFYKYATIHQVSAILYNQLKNSGNVDALRPAYASQISRYVLINKAIEKCRLALKEVDFAFVKGASLSFLYPIPAMRSMGDIDILIHEEDLSKVKNKLLENNFIFVDGAEDEWQFLYNKLSIEVHTHLLHKRPENKRYYSFFQNAWEYYKNGSLDWNFHFVYLLMHLKQHLQNNGVGFRQFFDLAVVMKNIQLNWEWIRCECEKIGILNFAKTVLQLNEFWFKVPSPCPVPLDSDFYEKATQAIFDNGIFGFENTDNENNELKKLVVNQGLSYRGAQRKFVFSQIFPNYSQMKRLPYCSYVRKFKFLLPLAWIHRLFYRILNNESWSSLYDHVSVPEEAIKEQAKWMQQWGL